MSIKRKEREAKGESESEVEEVQPSKGRKKIVTTTKTQRMINANQDDIPSLAGYTFTEALDDLPIELTKLTTTLNAWNNVRDTLTLRKSPIYTPMGLPTISILDCPPGKTKHRFVLTSDPVLETNVRHVLKDLSEERIDAWRIFMRDSKDPSSAIIPVFPKMTGKTKNQIRGGLLDRRVCATPAEAKEVAQRVVQGYNALDFDLDMSKMAVDRSYLPRTLVELVALRSLNNGAFDHGTLSEVYIGKDRNYELSTDIVDKADKAKADQGSVNVELKLWMFDQTGVSNTLRTMINPDKLDLARENEIEDVPSSFHYAGLYTGKRLGAQDPRRGMVQKLARLVQYKTFGKKGSVVQNQRFVNGMISGFHKAEFQTEKDKSERNGPVDGARALQAPFEHTGVVQIAPTPSSQKFLAKGQWISTSIRTCSLVLVAYCYQVFIDSFASGRGLLNAWQDLFVAAQMVNFGLITKEHACEHHCKCKNSDERERNEHWCMRCIKLFTCIQLVQLEDGRYVDRECAVSQQGRFGGDDDFTTRSWVKWLRQRVRHTFWRDTKLKKAPPLDEDREQRIWQLIETMIDGDKLTWQNGYNGEEDSNDARIDNKTRTERRATARTRFQSFAIIKHPKSLSFEAPFQVWVADGVAYYHYEDNFTLTSDSTNAVHGQKPPGCLPWYKAAMEHSAGDLDGPRDVKFWTRFDRAMDHCYILTLLLSVFGTLRLREALALPASFWTQLRDARWDGILLPAPYRLFNTRAVAGNRSALSRRARLSGKPVIRRPFPRWKANQIAAVKSFEFSVRTSPEYNPAGLTMPLFHEMPYFWREDTIPWDDTEDEFIDWLFDEMQQRRWTAEEECEPEDDIEDTPMNLLNELIVQWYQDGRGGRDILLHSQMTPYSRHGQNYSFGRHPDREPGDSWRTGCTHACPTSVAQYDRKLSSLIVELWTVNTMKLDHPVSGRYFPSQLPIMRQMLLDLADECKWYGRANTEVDSRKPINFPRKSTRRANGVLRRGGQQVSGADMNAFQGATVVVDIANMRPDQLMESISEEAMAETTQDDKFEEVEEEDDIRKHLEVIRD